MPIRKEGHLIGTVGLARMEVRPFSTDEIELTQTIAAQAAIVIAQRTAMPSPGTDRRAGIRRH